MIKKSLLKIEKVTHCSISLEWDIDPLISLTHIVLKLTKHCKPIEHLGTINISPEAIGYELISLLPNTLYEIQIAPCDNKRQYSWSNILICMTLKAPTYELYYPSEQLIAGDSLDSRELINSRNLKDWKEYVNCSYKCAKPKEIRKKILQRTIDWANAINQFEDIYDTADNCFQGPFVLKNHKDLT